MRYNNNSPLRTLARSHKWQALYSRSKDLKLQLFENTSDFSHIQTLFLQYLETYHSLFIDAYMNKEGIDEERIKNDTLTDAYLTYKKYKDSIDNQPNKAKKIKKNNSDIPSVIFTKRKAT